MILEFLCFVGLIVFILKVFRKPYLKVLNTLHAGWWLLCAVPSLLTLILYSLLYYPTPIYDRPENIILVFLVFALMVVFYLTVYLNFENITEYYQLKQDKEFLQMQIGLHKKEYDSIVEKVDATLIYRHDMRHHINAICALLDEERIPEARQYLEQLTVKFNKNVVEHYCENYSVNLILSSYINRAKYEHIDVTCKTAIPDQIPIDNIELGMVFANAIENAIHACKAIPDVSERKIRIVSNDRCGQLYIQISNPFVGEVLFDGDYPIPAQTDHGIGTRSIAAIAEKYDGVFSFCADSGIFKTTLILNYETTPDQQE